MKYFVSIFFLFFTYSIYGQVFQGVSQLKKYEPAVTELDRALKSNPARYLDLYDELRLGGEQSKDQVLLAALDVYQGSFHYFQNRIDSARFYFDRAMKLSSDIGHDQIFRTAKIRKIFTDEYRKTKYLMAQEMQEVYVDSYNKKDTINMLYSLNGLGLFYSGMDSVSLSLKIFYEALRLADMSKNMTEKGFIHNNLGLIKYDLGARDSAFSDFKRCLQIGIEENDIMLQAIGRQNMGLFYSSVDSIDLAKTEYLKVMNIGRDYGFTLYTLSSTTNLASLEMTLGNETTSDSLSRSALRIAKEGSILYAVPQIYFGRAYYMLKTKNYSQGHAMLDSAFAYIHYAQYSEVMPSYYHLRYRMYEEMGDHKRALETYKLKIEIDDSLDEIGNAKLLAELEFKYDDEKKERIRSIERNKLKLKIKQGEVDLAEYRQHVIIVVSVLIFIILVIIVLYFRLKQKSDNLFSFTIANKLEEERGRIARDLHDGLGQSMIVLKNKFNKLPHADQKEVEELNSNFSEVIEEVRSISRSLIPPELRRLGLLKSLKSMMDEIEKSSNYIITLEADCLEEIHFEDHQSIRIYRVIQELSTNTLKHSGATSIKLEATIADDHLLFVYQDNGKGMDLEKWKAANNSVGFKSIQQRLRYLSGSAKIDKVKTGFKLLIKIPIPNYVKNISG